MIRKDYLIVGDGFAALFFAFQLIKANKSFLLFSCGVKGASRVSAGIVNPVVLKKFTVFDKAQEQLELLKSEFKEMERRWKGKYFIDEPIHRIFHDEKEKALWLKKSKEPVLENFLSKEIVFLQGVENPYGCGTVLGSGRIDLEAWFKDALGFLEKNGYLVNDSFNYNLLDLKEMKYIDFHFKHVVFAEGIGVKNNPFFEDLPVQSNKGHHIKVELLEERLDEKTIKKKHFLFPLSSNLYYYGGTYDREAFLSEVDESAKEQLTRGLKEFYTSNFRIESVEFGFRPTVKDRRPLIGAHRKFKNLYVFNGLGARGLMNANYYAPFLFDHIEKGEALPSEIYYERFKE